MQLQTHNKKMIFLIINANYYNQYLNLIYIKIIITN